MKNKNKSASGFRKRIRVILAICIVFGGLLVASIVSSLFGEGGIKNYELFIRSETVYVILIFAVSLPVLLFCMLAAIKKRNKENEYLPAYLS